MTLGEFAARVAAQDQRLTNGITATTEGDAKTRDSLGVAYRLAVLETRQNHQARILIDLETRLTDHVTTAHTKFEARLESENAELRGQLDHERQRIDRLFAIFGAQRAVEPQGLPPLDSAIRGFTVGDPSGQSAPSQEFDARLKEQREWKKGYDLGLHVGRRISSPTYEDGYRRGFEEGEAAGRRAARESAGIAPGMVHKDAIPTKDGAP